MRWRVSSGKDIKVFNDPWVPGINEFRVAWKHGWPDQLRVSDLILESGE